MIYGYFMGSMMWYKTDPNPMCYIRTRSVLANLQEWNLGGVIKNNRNPKNPIRTPTGIRTLRPSVHESSHLNMIFIRLEYFGLLSITDQPIITKNDMMVRVDGTIWTPLVLWNPTAFDAHKKNILKFTCWDSNLTYQFHLMSILYMIILCFVWSFDYRLS